MQLHVHATRLLSVGFKLVASLAAGVYSCGIDAPADEPAFDCLGAQAGDEHIDFVAAVAVTPAFKREPQAVVREQGFEDFVEFAAFGGAQVPLVQREMDALPGREGLPWGELGEGPGLGDGGSVIAEACGGRGQYP